MARKKSPGTIAEARTAIRTAADELAVKSGCRFDESRAAFACDWIEDYCRLYEGDRAGKNFTLLDFQRDFVRRLFGWVKWSSDNNSWIRRFIHGALWASKKNGKSPLAAAINLYLTCGDGEQGQKVYQAAKNGDQARIAQKHAFNMVLQSPELLEECKLNNQTLQIAHLPTNSILMVLTGDDTRGAKAKEGLNGSVTFDEMHVVDREMYERVSRAGISRREPMVLSFSTAGDDPSSIGFERCQYGRQVNSGERIDHGFLHVEYSIPDSVTESEIDSDIDRYGKMANPSWGHIVKPAEFRDDWNRSKGKPRELARCLQYRFNRWVGSTNRWLSANGWSAGARNFTLADFAGRECYLAIDLSRTRDSTSAVFMFPGDDEWIDLFPMFWMPEQTARDRDMLFPYMSWAKTGDLRLTPGGVVSYSSVKADIRAAVRDHGLRVISTYFDPHYAEELTQQLIDGESIRGESEDGIGGERVAFPQTLMAFTGPAKEFERRVSAGLVRHPNNLVMNWQIGHCEVMTDTNQNIRPVKPNPNSGKSVDGVVAGVMTFADVQSVESSDSESISPLQVL